MKTIDVAQLPADVAALLTSQEKPVFLEQNGQPIGVIVSPDTYRRWQQRAAVDYSEEWSEEDMRHSLRRAAPSFGQEDADA